MYYSGGSRPSSKGGGGGGGEAFSSRPLEKGGEEGSVSKKKIFSLRSVASVWSKNNWGGGGPGPLPGSATVLHVWL